MSLPTSLLSRLVSYLISWCWMMFLNEERESWRKKEDLVSLYSLCVIGTMLALTNRAEPHSWDSTGRITPRNRHTDYAEGQCEIMKINHSLFHCLQPIHVRSPLFVFGILATGYQTKPLKMCQLRYTTLTHTHKHTSTMIITPMHSCNKHVS